MQVRRHRPSPPVRVQELQFHINTPDSEPRNILEEIVWHKEKEVEQQRSLISLQELQRQVLSSPAPLDFAAALKAQKTTPAIIAEVKKASPSKGVFREDFDPVAIARGYAQNQASCISVLTDQKFFQGGFDYLQQIRQAVDIPLLCKDFILHPYQIYQARCAGADAILLIAAILNDTDLRYFLKIIKALSMTVLLEVHDADELARVLDLIRPNPESVGSLLVGINNRNLKTFETTLQTTLDLTQTYGEDLQRCGIPIVSESGLKTPEDLQQVVTAGATAVLIGESFMKEANPGEALRLLLQPTP